MLGDFCAGLSVSDIGVSMLKVLKYRFRDCGVIRLRLCMLERWVAEHV